MNEDMVAREQYDCEWCFQNLLTWLDSSIIPKEEFNEKIGIVVKWVLSQINVFAIKTWTEFSLWKLWFADVKVNKWKINWQNFIDISYTFNHRELSFRIFFDDSLNAYKITKWWTQWFSSSGTASRRSREWVWMPNEILYHDEKKEALEVEKFIDVKNLFSSLGNIRSEQEFRTTNLLEELKKLINEFRKFPLVDQSLRFDIDDNWNFVYWDEKSSYKYLLQGKMVDRNIKLTVFFEYSDDEYTYEILLNESWNIISVRRHIFLVDMTEQCWTDVFKSGWFSNVLLLDINEQNWTDTPNTSEVSNVLLYESRSDKLLKKLSSGILFLLGGLGFMRAA